MGEQNLGAAPHAAAPPEIPMPLLRPSHRLFAGLPIVLLLACGGKATAPLAVVPPPPYFGQALPGTTPVPFAPKELTALSAIVAATEFSPDGNQCFAATARTPTAYQKIYRARFENGVWTSFQDVPFLADFAMSHEPVFSPDGRTLTFTGMKAGGSADLWTVSFANGTWGTPVALPSPVNSDTHEWRGSYTQDGTLYFGSFRSKPAVGLMQIYKAQRDASQNWAVEALPAPINQGSQEGDPCVAPDGRFLVFYSGRDGVSSDLYVTFRNAQGGWGDPIKLGPEFNTPAGEFGAHLSTDGKLLFFTRRSPEVCQVYWVATSAIDAYRPKG